jgi:O-antigen/teichoic acid export membrane protein
LILVKSANSFTQSLIICYKKTPIIYQANIFIIFTTYMGIIKRQSIKGIAVFVIGAAIHFITAIFLMQRILSFDDMAAFRVYYSLIMIFIIVGLGGINALLLKHTEEYKSNPEKLKTFNLITLSYTLVLSLLSVALFFIFQNVIYTWKGNNNAYLLKYFWCVPLSGFFYALIFYFEAYSIGTHRLTAPSIVKEVLLRIMLLVALLLYHFKLISISQFFLCYALSYALGFIILMLYCVLVRGYRIGFNKMEAKAISWKAHAPYIFFIFCVGLLGALILNSDQPIMYAIKGSLATDVYSIAVTIASLVTIPYKPLSSILLPFMYDAWQRKDMEKLNQINQQGGRNLTALGMLLFILLVANTKHVLPFLKPELHAFVWPLYIIGFGRVLDYLTGASTELLLSAPSHRKLALYMLFTYIFSIVCYIVLIPRYDVLGVAITCSATLIFFNVLKFLHLKKAYNLNALAKESFFCIALGFVVLGIQYLIPNLNNFILDASVRSLFICIVYASIVWKLKWVKL